MAHGHWLCVGLFAGFGSTTHHQWLCDGCRQQGNPHRGDHFRQKLRERLCHKQLRLLYADFEPRPSGFANLLRGLYPAEPNHRPEGKHEPQLHARNQHHFGRSGRGGLASHGECPQPADERGGTACAANQKHPDLVWRDGCLESHSVAARRAERLGRLGGHVCAWRWSR